jgi:two-component system CheB/CheR fusion protein
MIVVGLGASAGGLAALKQFFGTVPADSGFAYVVVVHLPAEHDSYLADLLQPHASIPVLQVVAETQIEANHVYVIPPGRNLSAVDSHLRLAPLAPAHLGRAPVDHFLKTLAETHDGASVGVILSGTGSDGARGVRYVREQGGMTLAQDPDEAEFDGMPRSAIDTRLVDHVLPIGSMFECIREFAGTHPQLPISDADAREESAPIESPDALQTVLTLVRLRTGHDFLRYKQSTVNRRVARRMQVLNIARLDEYLTLLRTDEQEAVALLDDLLINVTSFFRDPHVFQALEANVIPQLFDRKERGEPVRVWSVGCATGEEAYSLGMLLLEEAGRRPNSPPVQIFATDLHERSLQKGRDALFSEIIEEEVTAERVERFFRRESGGYRVTKALRDIVVFATHNLLRDPPFSRLDLIVCRNVLIYLQRDIQEEVVEVFHYALRPGGRLLLGTAETLDRSDLFRVESKEAHLYRRRDARRGATRLPPLTLSATIPRVRAVHSEVSPPMRVAPDVAFATVHQRLVERHAAPSLLVGPEHEVAHLSDHVGRYLQHPGGQPTSDLFKLVRDEFRLELRTAMHMVRERREPWSSRPIEVQTGGEPVSVVLRVVPAEDSELEGFLLVIFDESNVAEEGEAKEPHAPDEGLRELEGELEQTRSRMQAVIEEFETSQEEMRASNEELQSANEELRSTLEELETSREELQSVNEELQTLNQENRHKVEELSQLSSDLQNLLQATDVATLFLDRNLRILRYTPRVTEIFNVRHTDRGRPLADLTHRLGYPALIDDARRVLNTLVPSEREVETSESSSHYLLRLAPYRTVDDHIEGVVITMVDITPLKRTQAALARSEERQSLLVRLHDLTRPLTNPLDVQSAATRMLGDQLDANRSLYVEIDGRDIALRGEFDRNAEALTSSSVLHEFSELFRPTYLRGEALIVTDVETDRRFTDAQRAAYRKANVRSFVAAMFQKDGRWIAGMSVQSAEPRQWANDDALLVHEFAERTALAVARAYADLSIRESEERHRLIVEGASDYVILTMDLDGKILTWSPGAAAIMGWSAAEAVGQSVAMTFTPEDRARGEPEHEMGQAQTTGMAPDVRWHLRKDGSRVFIDGVSRALTDERGRARAILKVGQDVTARRDMEQSLRELNQSLEQRVIERTAQLAEAGRIARDSEQRFRRRVTQAEEDERGRLARDLHDEAGQFLTALGLGLQAIADVAPDGSDVARRTTELRTLADTLGRELHTLAVRLRPKALDDFGLQPALQTYIDEWSRLSGIPAALHAAVAKQRLPEPIETAIYRIVQEALTNVARHSNARHVSVLVERRDGQLVTVVEDDGVGFDSATIESEDGSGLGLAGIRERVALLGGGVEIESVGGTGTTIFVRLPIDGVAEPNGQPAAGNGSHN